MPEIYEPSEDSYLIFEQIKEFARGNALDMGTGTGILALEAAKRAEFVYAADINEDALRHAEKKAREHNIKNIKFVLSDLFGYFRQNPLLFDLIVFNPPYLPEDKNEPKEIFAATTGGKKGYEILERFFSEASNYLMPDGKIIIVFSTLTNKDKVHSIMERYCFNFQKLSERSFDFETIFVYLAEKSEFLKNIESKGITDAAMFAKGHRGIVYTGIFDDKMIAIKNKRPDSKAAGRIENEARWLKFLNKKGIGPKYIDFEGGILFYEFVDGGFIEDFAERANKQDIKKVLKDILEQCFVLDKLRINKEEMHHPVKHIIVSRNKPIMIDFERVHATEEPKNVTQFCQFLSYSRMFKILKAKEFKFKKSEITKLCRIYKKDMNEGNFKRIVKSID